ERGTPDVSGQARLGTANPAEGFRMPQPLRGGNRGGRQSAQTPPFQAAIEQADAELVLTRRRGKQGQGMVCRGTTPFTFKTVFGTVGVQRRRIEHKADGSTEVPSAHAWQTPHQVALTAGLRDAACDGMLRDSAQQTVARIETHADEVGVLAKTTVLEIVHDEGEQLQAAAHTRAEAVYARDPEALRLLVPGPPEQQQS